MYSSNIGEAKIAIAVGGEKQQEYLSAVRAAVYPEFELKEVGKPHFPAKWREVNVMTIAYGHGICGTPLHIATAGSAMVNGGILRPATFSNCRRAACAAGRAGDFARNLRRRCAN